MSKSTTPQETRPQAILDFFQAHKGKVVWVDRSKYPSNFPAIKTAGIPVMTARLLEVNKDGTAILVSLFNTDGKFVTLFTVSQDSIVPALEKGHSLVNPS